MQRPDTPPHIALEREVAWLSAFAAQLARDAAVADDAAQEAWVRVLEQGVQPSRSELARRVRAYVSEHWRGAARRRRRETLAARPEAAPEVADHVERDEALAQLEAHLGALGAPLREALLARHREGLSTAAIAARAGVAEDTVRWRLREGALRLRRSLGPRHFAVLAFAPPPRALVAAAASAPTAVAVIPLTVAWFGMKTLYAATLAALAIVCCTWWLQRSEAPGPMPHGNVAVLPEAPGPRSGSHEMRDAPARLAANAAAPRGSAVRSDALPPAEVGEAQSSPDPLPVEPALLVVHLRPEPGLVLPDAIDALVHGFTEAGLSEQLPFVGQQVLDGALRLTLARGSEHAHLPIVGTELHLRAPGLLGTKAPAFGASWAPGSETTIEVALRFGAELQVLIVDGRDGAPLDDLMIQVLGAGAGAEFGASGRRNTTDPLRLSLPADLEEGDWLFAQSLEAGLAAGAWPLREVRALPPRHDGVRVLELTKGATIEGRLSRADGLPLDAGCAVHYATRLGVGTGTPTYPHWAARDGIAPVDATGRFCIEGLVPGACVLELRGKGNAVEALALAPPRIVDVTGDLTTFVDWVVPATFDELVLDLEWHTSPDVLLFFDLLREDEQGARTLLATRHFVLPKTPLPVRLTAGALDPAARYVLRIGNDVNARQDRALTVAGSRVRLQHKFVDGDTSPLRAVGW